MKSMQPRLICLYVCLLLGGALPFFLGANSSTHAGPGPTGDDASSDASDCVGGCDAVKDTTGELSDAEIEVLLAGLADGSNPDALETLLFHGPIVRSYFAAHEEIAIDPLLSRRLQRELAKTHVFISVRVVDSDEKVRMEMRERVPIGIKQHLHPHDADGFAPPEVSFTVQRVGLHHLWTRI